MLHRSTQVLSPYYQFPSLVVSHHFYITRTLTPVILQSRNGNCIPPLLPQRGRPPEQKYLWSDDICWPPVIPGSSPNECNGLIRTAIFFLLRIRDFPAYNNVHDPSQHHLLTSSIPNLCHWLLSLLPILTTSLHLITLHPVVLFTRCHTTCTYNCSPLLHHSYSC